MRRLLNRAFSADAELASDAIRRIEQRCDPALAALAWSFFWIQQGEIFQAKRELERVQSSNQKPTIWAGIDLMLLGHIHIDLGEAKIGNRLIREGRRMLHEPADQSR